MTMSFQLVAFPFAPEDTRRAPLSVCSMDRNPARPPEPLSGLTVTRRPGCTVTGSGVNLASKVVASPPSVAGTASSGLDNWLPKSPDVTALLIRSEPSAAAAGTCTRRSWIAHDEHGGPSARGPPKVVHGAGQ
jgi:hypothetical protein